MASLSTKRGIWYLWLNVSGRRRGISLKTRDYKEAVRKAAEIEGTQTIPLYKRPVRLMYIFAQWKALNSHLSSEYKDLATLLWNQLVMHFGDIDINTIQTRDVIAFMTRRRRSGDSETYLGIRMRTYKSILNWARKHELTITTVFTNIEMPKRKSRIEFLTESEIGRLISAAGNKPLYQGFIEFMLATGCRRGELYNLKWADVNDHYIEFNGKTGRRSFPYQLHIADILAKIRRNQFPLNTFVFADGNGRRFNRTDTISHFVKRYIRKAGLKESYVAHTLRHTFASHLVLKGIPIYTISRLMGHINVSTTEKYAHLAPEQISAEIDYLKL